MKSNEEDYCNEKQDSTKSVVPVLDADDYDPCDRSVCGNSRGTCNLF